MIQTDATISGKRSPAKLGEELPIFCEKCGYSLFGLPQLRCEQCDILHFHCPECAHHQPINTLRPAFQKMLGRFRAAGLVLLILFKLNFFGWVLFAWGALASDWCLHGEYTQRGNSGFVRYVPGKLLWQWLTLFAVFALAFGMVARMFLLRWRRSSLVGITLAGLVLLAMVCGVALRIFDIQSMPRQYANLVGSPWTVELAILFTWTAGITILGAMGVWPIWVGLVRAFISRDTGSALLAWQRSLSEPGVSALGRE
jgi:hypothetical protein